MREITHADEERFWRKVREDFPDDEMMQEIHFIRLKLMAEMEGMSPAEQVRYINEMAEPFIEAARKEQGRGHGI
jgi:hypothetical protein